MAAGFWSKVKTFPGAQKAAEDQINQLLKKIAEDQVDGLVKKATQDQITQLLSDQTLNVQDILRLIAKTIDPDFGTPSKPAGFDPTKLNPFTKAEGDALLKAATDTVSLAYGNPPQGILCSESILTWNEASDVVGRRVANTFIVIQVVIRNLDPDHEFLLQDVEALLNTGRFYSTHDHDVVRGVAEMGQEMSPRNIAVNTATAIGTSVGAAYAVLSVNAKVGLNIWTAGVVPGLQTIWPDNTVRQVARIDNLSFAPGGSSMVIPKNSAIGILAFLPQKQFLWKCVPPGNTANQSTADNANGKETPGSDDGQAGSASANGGSDEYACQQPPQRPDYAWLGARKRDAALKDLNSAQLNRLQQSMEVLVAGVHVQQVSQSSTITDLSCDSDQQMFKDDAVTCQLKGTNLNKVTAVTLQNPSAGAKGLTPNGTVKSQGDNTIGTVSFPACQLNLLPKATYQVSIVASGGDAVQKATFVKKDAPLQPTCTATLRGSSIACDFSKMGSAEAAQIETVTLSKYDKDSKSFPTAIAAVKLDANLKASFKGKAIGTILASAVPSDVTVEAQAKGESTAIDTCVTPTTITAPSAPGTEPKLVLDLPASTSAGAVIAVKVTAQDESGKLNSGFTGTVHFTSNDKSAVLPHDYTFKTTDNGTAAFSVTLKTKGNRTLTVASNGVTSASGSITVK